MIDLSSDTQTRPSPGMRQAMYDAEVGDEQSNLDPTVIALQEMVAELTGKEAALFLPSGTMCNLIAVTVHTKPGDIVILDRRCHIAIAEGGAAARFAGGMMRPVAGDRGVFTVEQVQAEWSCRRCAPAWGQPDLHREHAQSGRRQNLAHRASR